MNKETNKILPNQNVVTMISVGGIKAIISTKGIVDLNKAIPEAKRKKIEKILEPGLENILEGGLVEGEFKNNSFYVKCIRDNNGKILDIYETKDWAMIMGFNTSLSMSKRKFKDADKRFDVRPESSFNSEYYRDMTTGKGSWRRKVAEAMNNG